MKYKINILLPIIQVFFFIFSYELINIVAHKMDWVTSRGVAWGVSMEYYCFIYLLFVLISNALIYFFPGKTLLIAIASIVAFSIWVAPTLNGYPYRSAIVIIIGALGFLINYIAYQIIKRRESLKHQNGIENTPHEMPANPANIIYEPSTIPANGVIFLLANWSGPAIAHFQYIKFLLAPYPNLPLYVYDIDKENFLRFMEKYNILSHGNGEVFWLYKGEIQSRIQNYDKDRKHAPEYMKTLCEKFNQG
ncbi:hypothetical protein F0L74_11725 [Chitinophaga agrisoli]|uniref:Uncharacterized protein n=1 Tax=Chitinophaga agrisoli TaxID=2607653 RepID=A0A5B2VY52_9BACT|nr:hypothetical protein [Chitinophaga agrisoli]KAA2243177.1 hypothetical protein F0L74_11725 [Chitinophaga agrisoli]